MTTLGFGARIRQAILDKGSQKGERYTNVQFAKDVGMLERGEPYSTSVVTEWISERSEPGIATFRAMAAITGKTPAWLMALDVELPKPAHVFKNPPRFAPRPVVKKRKEG